MLVIHDEALARQLEQIAQRENRPVEDVIKSMVDHYPREAPAEAPASGMSEEVKRVRRKIYAMARRHWESVGDSAHLADQAEDILAEHFADDYLKRIRDQNALE